MGTIGERRHRITIERAADGVDGFGQPVKTWSTLATVWALVQPLRGGERFSAQQTVANVDHRIITRYRSDLAELTPKDRITWGGRVFDVTAVINRDHRNRELEILAREHI